MAGEGVQLRIDGMTSAGCAIGIERALLDFPGVLSAKVNWQTEIGVMSIVTGKVLPEDLIKAKVQEQYTLRLETRPPGRPDERLLPRPWDPKEPRRAEWRRASGNNRGRVGGVGRNHAGRGLWQATPLSMTACPSPGQGGLRALEGSDPHSRGAS